MTRNDCLPGKNGIFSRLRRRKPEVAQLTFIAESPSRAASRENAELNNGQPRKKQYCSTTFLRPEDPVSRDRMLLRWSLDPSGTIYSTRYFHTTTRSNTG